MQAGQFWDELNPLIFEPQKKSELPPYIVLSRPIFVAFLLSRSVVNSILCIGVCFELIVLGLYHRCIRITMKPC